MGNISSIVVLEVVSASTPAFTCVAALMISEPMSVSFGFTEGWKVPNPERSITHNCWIFPHRPDISWDRRGRNGIERLICSGHLSSFVQGWDEMKIGGCDNLRTLQVKVHSERGPKIGGHGKGCDRSQDRNRDRSKQSNQSRGKWATPTEAPS
ncbi:hypothetical protein CR513_62115, partial [Mucuna pruriens]